MWVCNNHLIFVHFSCDFLLQFCCAHECSEIERFTEKYNNKDEKIVFDILASMQRARSFIFIAIIFCNKPGREKKDGEWIWNSQLDAVWTGVKKNVRHCFAMRDIARFFIHCSIWVRLCTNYRLVFFSSIIAQNDLTNQGKRERKRETGPNKQSFYGGSLARFFAVLQFIFGWECRFSKCTCKKNFFYYYSMKLQYDTNWR